MTYTTMISQCGTQQQLRRALELVAEMRSRGIQCNVHTYSALMNVCIKGERVAAARRRRAEMRQPVRHAPACACTAAAALAPPTPCCPPPVGSPRPSLPPPPHPGTAPGNELDLALDVYRQMLAEGCTPNLVTYNTLIDVYGKTGAWEEAIRVLDALERQGIDPEIRTYNTGEAGARLVALEQAPGARLHVSMLAAACDALHGHAHGVCPPAGARPCKADPAASLPSCPPPSSPSPRSHHRVQHERAGPGGAAHLRAHAGGGGAAHRHHLHRPHLRLRQERAAGPGAADLPGGGALLAVLLLGCV